MEHRCVLSLCCLVTSRDNRRSPADVGCNGVYTRKLCVSVAYSSLTSTDDLSRSRLGRIDAVLNLAIAGGSQVVVGDDTVLSSLLRATVVHTLSVAIGLNSFTLYNLCSKCFF